MLQWNSRTKRSQTGTVGSSVANQADLFRIVDRTGGCIQLKLEALAPGIEALDLVAAIVPQRPRMSV